MTWLLKRIMHLLGIVLLSISLLILGFLADAFSEAYTRWGLPPGAKVRFGKGRINAVKYFPDGNRLAVATAIGTWIYDVHTGEELDLLTGHTRQVSSVALSRDGKRIATGSTDNSVLLWDAQTGEQTAALIRHTGAVSSVAFSPNGERLASVSYDRTLQLWDGHTGDPLKTLRGHVDSVYCVAYSPNGGLLASIAADSTIRLWGALTGEPLKTIVLQTPESQRLRFRQMVVSSQAVEPMP